MTAPDLELSERLEARIHREPMSGCWLWTCGINTSGYGVVGIRGDMLRAHRASWEAFRGPIPPGGQVLHRCDVPSCINPAHLFLGSHIDNMRDMAAKGRWRRADQRGELGPRAKLTNEVVRKIKRMLQEGADRRVIARETGATPQTISRISLGHIWTNV